MGEWEWVHAAVGGVATVIFLFQTLGTAGDDAGGDADVDFDYDGGTGADAVDGLSSYLSVRNFVAFFIGYGWVTLAALLSDVTRVRASVLGVLAGSVFVVASLFLLRTFLKFQEDGSLQLARQVGKTATVYIAIGASAGGVGKVLVDTRKGRMELPARTRSSEKLSPGQLVRIVNVEDEMLWVERVDADSFADKGAKTV